MNDDTNENSHATIQMQRNELETIDAHYAKDNETYHVETLELEIAQLQEIASRSILEIGRRLCWIKERAGHGQFLHSLETVAISQRQAHKYMTVYKRLENQPSRARLSHIGISKALELVQQLDDDELDALANGADVRGLTHDELDTLTVRELKTRLRTHEKHSEKKECAYEKQIDELQNEKQMLIKRIEHINLDTTWQILVNEYLALGQALTQDLLDVMQKFDAYRARIQDALNNNNEQMHTAYPIIMMDFEARLRLAQTTTVRLLQCGQQMMDDNAHIVHHAPAFVAAVTHTMSVNDIVTHALDKSKNLYTQ